MFLVGGGGGPEHNDGPLLPPLWIPLLVASFVVVITLLPTNHVDYTNVTTLK